RLSTRVPASRATNRAARPPAMPEPHHWITELTPSYTYNLNGAPRATQHAAAAPAAHARPRVLFVTPFCVFPPRHGGARRIEGLLRELRREFDIVLVTDEASLYDARSLAFFDGLHAVHFVQRPRDQTGERAADLGERARAH